MDYEQKYKEALKKIREGLQSLPDGTKISGVTRAFLEEVFPELQESEDERIRKELIRETKGSEERLFEVVTNEEFIDWLEKQGEQNFTDNKEKLDLLNFIRKETGCGLAEANNALLKLNKVLKQHPVPIMDKPRKLKIELEE